MFSSTSNMGMNGMFCINMLGKMHVFLIALTQIRLSHNVLRIEFEIVQKTTTTQNSVSCSVLTEDPAGTG